MILQVFRHKSIDLYRLAVNSGKSQETIPRNYGSMDSMPSRLRELEPSAVLKPVTAVTHA